MASLTIHRALSPRVSVLASSDVDQVISTNGLPDLIALLRPFQDSVERISVRTSQLETRLCDSFPLRFDHHDVFQPGQPQQQQQHRPYQLAKDPEQILDETSAHISSNAKRWAASINPDQDLDQRLQNASVPLERRTPWFTEFRNLVLSQRFLSRHETFAHPVAQLLAVSSASPDPMNEFARIYEVLSSSRSHEAHPYMHPTVLTYYVLLHDVRTSGEDLSQSLELLENVKKTYGIHCCLLPINSADEDAPVPDDIVALWKPFQNELGLSIDSSDAKFCRNLDHEDIKRLRGFVRELTAQSIVPCMERCVQQWNEQLANSRKGLTGRLFGASRKLFGAAGKSVVQSAANPGYNSQHDFYPYNSIEAQSRRLADFAFTIRDYKLAAATYDICRKDFGADKAWTYSAAANEMLGISMLMNALMVRTRPPEVDSFLSQAYNEYSLKPNRENSALRATLLYYEAYRLVSHLRPASAALVRMAGASEEVIGALLLEQAAVADLGPGKPALRKHAIHLVMAGHRYQSCGQKLLSLRCYAQAATCYKGKSWTLIENHIENELGLQAHNDGDAQAAVAHLLTLLRPSQCSAEEHEAQLNHLLNAYKYTMAEDASKPSLALPQPVFDPARAILRVNNSDAQDPSLAEVDPSVWDSLQEQFMQNGFNDRIGPDGKATKRKRPFSLQGSDENEVAIGKTFWLEASALNPLKIPVSLKDVTPILSIDDVNSKGDTSDTPDVPAEASRVESETIKVMTLEPGELRQVSIPIKISSEGVYRVTGIKFTFAELLPLYDSFKKRGKRLTSTKQQRMEPTYAPDMTLRISVHEPKPALSVQFVSPPSSMFLGEETEVAASLKNIGSVPITDVRTLCSVPEAAKLLLTDDMKRLDDGEHAISNDLHGSSPQSINLGTTTIAPNEEAQIQFLLRGVQPGQTKLAWLFVFADEAGNSFTARLAHRVRVDPLLNVAIRPMVSTGLALTHDLNIQATVDPSCAADVVVKGVSIMSPQWEVLQDANTNTFKGAQIGSGQSCRFRTVAKRRDGPGGSLSYTVDRLRTLLQNREINAKEKAPSCQVRLSHQPGCSPSPISPLFEGERRHWRRIKLAQQFNGLSERDRLQAFTLYEPQDVDVVVHWELAESQRRGQVYVFGLYLEPSTNELIALSDASESSAVIRSMYAQTAKEKASMLKNLLASRLARNEPPLVVEVGLASPGKEVEHDFGSKGAARVGVEFRVRNLSAKVKVGFEIHLERLTPEASAGRDVARWTGRQVLRGELEPRSAAALAAKVSIESAGLFDVGPYTLKTVCYAPTDPSGKTRLCEWSDTRSANCSVRAKHVVQ